MQQETSRSQSLAALSNEVFDVVVIGGGLSGAAVARDAALRGLKVCLFEQGDFASGATGNSSGIAGRGLRDIRAMELGLARAIRQERPLLRKLLPHLVAPQSFCYPVYDDGPDPMWKVRMGFTVSDNLGGLGNGNKERHQQLTAHEALSANPRLRSRSLTGAFRYWDDRLEEARICIETVLSAEDAGARCFNYTRVTAARRRPSAMFEVEYEDVAGGGEGSVRTRAIANCTGVWSDIVMSEVLKAPSGQTAPARSVMAVVPRIEGQDALYIEDRRGGAFFALPWDGTTVIGGTGAAYDGGPDKTTVEQHDLDALLQAANYCMPASNLRAEDVVYAFAGVSSVVSPSGKHHDKAAAKHGHRVLNEPEGVVSLVGGTAATFRRMAQDTVDALAAMLGGHLRPCATATQPYFPTIDPRIDRRADLSLWAALVSRYGPRAGSVFDFCLSQPDLAEPIAPGQSMRLGEVIYALRFEKALTLDDVVYRRTRLAWSPDLNDALRGRLAAAADRFAPQQ